MEEDQGVQLSIDMVVQVGDQKVQEEGQEALQVDKPMWKEGVSAQREDMKEGLTVLTQDLEQEVPRDRSWVMTTGSTVLNTDVRRAPETEEVQCLIVQVGEDMQVLVEEGGPVHLLIARAGEREHQSQEGKVLRETDDPIALVETGDLTVLIGIGGPGVLKGGLIAQPEEDLALHLILGTGAYLTPPYLMLILLGRCLLLHSIINTNSFPPWPPQHTQATQTHLKDCLLTKGWRGSTVSGLNTSKLLPWTSVVLPQGFLVFNLITPLLCHLVGPNMQHHCHLVLDCQP